MSHYRELVLPDVATTLAVGRKLSQQLQRGMVVHFLGELGSGKTTLVQGILKGFGITDLVQSPTFTLVNEYSLAQMDIYHFDLYRIEHSSELEAIGFRDYFNQGSLCLIEWPQRAADWLPEADITCYIDILEEGRRLHIKTTTTRM